MVGFIRAFDRVEIVVTLARSCIDPMIPHHEKFIIKSTFTDIPYTQWAETSPKPMLRNVAKLAEVKLDFELRPKKSTKTPDEGIQSKELLDTFSMVLQATHPPYRFIKCKFKIYSLEL